MTTPTDDVWVGPWRHDKYRRPLYRIRAEDDPPEPSETVMAGGEVRDADGYRQIAFTNPPSVAVDGLIAQIDALTAQLTSLNGSLALLDTRMTDVEQALATGGGGDPGGGGGGGPVLLDAPANVAATAGDGQVTLSWDAVVGAATYQPYRDGAAVGAPITATQLVDTNLVNGQTYAYTVRALDGASVGGTMSAAVSATPQGTVQMEFLGEIATKGDTANSTTTVLTLGAGQFWAAGNLLVLAVNSGSASDTGMAATDSAGNTWTAVTASGVNATGSGKTQMFCCIATTAASAGATVTITGNSTRRAAILYRFSSPVGTSATTLDVFATATDAGSGTLALGPSASTAGASAVVAAIGWGSGAGPATPGTGYTEVSDHVSTNNNFSVAAAYKLTTGPGAQSTSYGFPSGVAGAGIIAAFKAVPAGSDTSPPSVPTGLAATPGNTQVALTWNPSSDNVGVAGYRIYRDGVFAGSSLGPSYVATGLVNGTTYAFTVAAFDVATNASAQSSSVNGTPSAGSGNTHNVVPYITNSPWNTLIGSSPVVLSNSASQIAKIVGLGKLLTCDPDQYTLPIYIMDGTEPLRDVTAAWREWPNGDRNNSVSYGTTTRQLHIPVGAQAADGSDAQIIFWNPDTGDYVECFQFRSTGSNTYAATSVRVVPNHTLASQNNVGRFADRTGGRGAGTTYFAGTIRPWEIAQGVIHHALAMAFQWPAGPRSSSNFVYPASKTDAANPADSGFPVEGARLQLNPAYDISGLNSFAKIVAKALQDYGCYVIDNSGSTKLYIESRLTAGWAGSITASTVSGIPLNQFRVIQGPSPV